MSTAVRINRLTVSGGGNRSLANAERHGKRLDAISNKRRVRDDGPLCWNTLDLSRAYAKHVRGAKISQRCKAPVLHCLFQWPTNISLTLENQKLFLKHSIHFANSVFGGNAVFAGRFDRDEAGEHTADVFVTPIYQKSTKAGLTTWVSTSKHLKLLCEKHRLEIERRQNGKFTDGLRQQGIALQSEWRSYLASIGVKLEPKREKASFVPDRLEPEQYGQLQDLKRKEAIVDAKLKELNELQAQAELVKFEAIKYLQSLKDWSFKHGTEAPPLHDFEP